MNERSTVIVARCWPYGVALLIVAVAAGVIVWGGRDDDLQAEPGQVVVTPFSIHGLHTSSLRLPFGVVDVGVTDPVTDPDDTSVLDGREPPDDGSFVGLRIAASSTQYAQPVAPGTDDDAVVADREPAVRVALVADGRAYPIVRDPAAVTTTRLSADRSVWVAVGGEPTDVRVAVSYDGVTQTIDPRTGRRSTGRAAPLYDLPASAGATTVSCGTPSATPSFRRDTAVDENRGDNGCEVQVLGSLPYLPRLGWAPAGSVWFTLRIATEASARFVWTGSGERTLDYRANFSGAELSASLDGVVADPEPLPDESPVAYLPRTAQAARLAVFRVSARTGGAHRLAVTATYVDAVPFAVSRPAGAPARPTVAVTYRRSIR